MKRKRRNKTANLAKGYSDADQYLDQFSRDHRILRMKKYTQHGSVSTYDHVTEVARTSLMLNRRFHFHADEKQLVRGALLHDYYLYDWHHHRAEGLHGFRHPERALRRAEQDFTLTEKERNMIRSHMWPLTLFHMPGNRESWLICLADKMVSTQETLFRRKGFTT